jgi:hypothetical protein
LVCFIRRILIWEFIISLVSNSWVQRLMIGPMGIWWWRSSVWLTKTISLIITCAVPAFAWKHFLTASRTPIKICTLYLQSVSLGCYCYRSLYRTILWNRCVNITLHCLHITSVDLGEVGCDPSSDDESSKSKVKLSRYRHAGAKGRGAIAPTHSWPRH